MGLALIFIYAFLKPVVAQIAIIFGLFFVLGYIISKLQEWTGENYQRAFGWRGIKWTAWLGTPVHELAHVFFAKIFRHRLDRVSLFAPNQQTGQLGEVQHSFNRKSVYQRLGNFFIGAGPLIFGAGVLILLFYFLHPDGRLILSDAGRYSILDLEKIFRAIFNPEFFGYLRFWLFIYLSFAVASHLAPSKQDRKNMWGGFVWVIFLLLILNGLALPFKFDLTAFILAKSPALALAVSLFVYAIFLSFIHFFLSFFASRVYRSFR